MIRQTIYGVLAVTLLVGTLVVLGLVSNGVSAQGTPTPSPDPDDVLELAWNFSGSNADWMPVIQEFDGVAMVLVPAGCFEMGSTDEEIEAVFQQCETTYPTRSCENAGFEAESPKHRVCFEEPFWMDRTEVTNAQFTVFKGLAASGSYWRDEAGPREQITWTEASAFCESRGGRLPTEAEWEYAARGPDSLIYPWGNEWAPDKVGLDEDASHQTADVGSWPAGVSWVGALDMSGNVWEWVADWYDRNYYGALDDGTINPTGPAAGEARVLRGGSRVHVEPYSFRTAFRLKNVPDSRFLIYGFRCARSMDTTSALPAATAEPAPEPTLVDPETAALPAGAHNTDWTPVIQEFDGVEMVLVPAGCFQMGSTEEQIEAAFDACEREYHDPTEKCERFWFQVESPQHEVCFSEPFWLDRYEVSQGQFEQFDGHAAIDPVFLGNDLPRESITWFEARDYCEQRGARLPTEAEWEYAARGPDGLVYPWGNTFECSRGNFDDETEFTEEVIVGGAGCDGFDRTSPVGSFPAGMSWVGVLDMGGNVWEWVSSLYQPYPYSEMDKREGNNVKEYRVVRGGAWDIIPTAVCSAAFRQNEDPRFGYSFNGLRCARSR